MGFNMTTGTLFILALLAAALAGHAAESPEPLWRIGQAGHRAAEFALAPTNYTAFLERFGSPDQAYYVGLSQAGARLALRSARTTG